MTKLSDVQLNTDQPDPRTRVFLASIESFDEIGSTSDYLMAGTPPPTGQNRVAIAKHQTSGRGRRGQKWHSSSASSICLSMAHTFAHVPDKLPSVTLAAGVSIVVALKDLGAKGVALKWPNDLMIGDAKFGGILAERQQRKDKLSTIVVGVGLNIDLQSDPRSFDGVLGDRPVADLSDCFKRVPTYESIANLLIDALRNAFVEFESRGFSAFKETWRSFDWLQGKSVSITVADRLSVGVCEGIDSDGALLLHTSEGTQRIISGSVHVDERSSAVNS